jgi:hypothetical protein
MPRVSCHEAVCQPYAEQITPMQTPPSWSSRSLDSTQGSEKLFTGMDSVRHSRNGGAEVTLKTSFYATEWISGSNLLRPPDLKDSADSGKILSGSRLTIGVSKPEDPARCAFLGRHRLVRILRGWPSRCLAPTTSNGMEP